MKDILFLSQRIPYPPTKGDKIRSFHILRHLARSHRVYLGCLADDPADLEHAAAVAALCAEVRVTPLSPRRARLRSLPALLDGRPLTLPYFRDAALAAWAVGVLERVRPDAAFVYSSAMAQYLECGPRPPRVVMDFVDVDSDKWRQYATRRRGPMAWLFGREARALLECERAAAEAADAVLLVSEAEAALFRRLAPASADKVLGLANGIDTAAFSPDAAWDDPWPDAGRPRLVFTGAMDYWPNVDAVRWFTAEVLPLIQARLPEARFAIVGSNPATEVMALGRPPAVLVTGRVPRVQPWLAHAEVAVAPLRVARGIQNKVLEAMAMALPVVATPEAFEGIDARPGHDLLVAAGAEAFAAAVAEAVSRTDLGPAARARVQAVHGWGRTLERIEGVLLGERVAG